MLSVKNKFKLRQNFWKKSRLGTLDYIWSIVLRFSSSFNKKKFSNTLKFSSSKLNNNSCSGFK